MSLKKEYNQVFIIEDIGKPTTSTSKTGLLQRRRELRLKDPFALEKEGAHRVLFLNASLRFLENLQVGQHVMLHFELSANTSVSGIVHTNIVPKKILKL